MSFQCNENSPLDNQDVSNKKLNEKLDELEAKLNAMLGDQNNKKPDSNPVSPQVSSPNSKPGDSKDESKSRGAWLHAITDIFNNLTQLVPTILNSNRGFPALFGYGGLVVGGTCAILIAFGSNKEGLKMIYGLGLLGIGLAFIVFMVWVFWDPDRPGRRKRGLGSEKKKNKQQNADNNIDNSENDDNMKGSLKVIKQNKERSHIKILWIEDPEDVRSHDVFLDYLKFRMLLLEDMACGSEGFYMTENAILQRIFIETFYSKIIQIDFLFSLSQEKYKIDKIIINSKVVDLFNESIMDEIISLINYRSSSDFDKVFKLFFQSLRKNSEKIILQSDLKMSKERRKEINYDIYNSFQLNKEKKKSNLSIQKHLFKIPEIKSLSRNSTVTKESNIPIHKFSFVSQANTNQCSTEDDEIQIVIPKNQKTKSNKLLRKKINLN